MFELGMESVRNLQAFVTGMFGLDRFYEWLVDKEYDDSLPSDERDALASIRLVALEVTEGMRSPGELEMSTMALLKASVGSSVEDGADLTGEPYVRKTWLSYAWEMAKVDARAIVAAFPVSALLPTPAAWSVNVEASTPAGGVLDLEYAT